MNVERLLATSSAEIVAFAITLFPHIQLDYTEIHFKSD